ncbi:MAG TPA: DUF6265 family protein [Lacunisphaera sp.]|jgi:hypothetical protein|nr:DUF6265 family protein [Lacunisphaera sp.]
MKLARAFLVVLVATGLVATAVAADAAKRTKPAPSPAIAKLGWLAGRWRMEVQGRVVDEEWMTPAAGVMLGMARTVVRGKVTEHEFMQVREGPGGALFFIAQPSGQKEAAYQIKSLTDTEAVFENTEHDFPQRIRYTHRADDTVLAAIEGVAPDGQPKRVEFTYRRVNP